MIDENDDGGEGRLRSSWEVGEDCVSSLGSLFLKTRSNGIRDNDIRD